MTGIGKGASCRTDVRAAGRHARGRPLQRSVIPPIVRSGAAAQLFAGRRADGSATIRTFAAGEPANASFFDSRRFCDARAVASPQRDRRTRRCAAQVSSVRFGLRPEPTGAGAVLNVL